MRDLTLAFQNHIIDKKKVPEETIQSNQTYFNVYTQDILKMLSFVLKLMESSREKYFAPSILIAGSFSEQEKEEFDSQVINSIKICKVKILDLQNLLKEQKSFLQSKNKTEYAHKEVAIGSLMQILNQVSSKFKEFKTYRQRQKERALNLTRFKTDRKKDKEMKISHELNQEEKHILTEQDENLQQENKMLLMRYTDDLQDIIKTQEQIREISQLISKMSDTLVRQDLTTDQILKDANDSLKSVEQANTNLIEATKLNERMGYCWSILFLVMAFILIFYDFINS